MMKFFNLSSGATMPGLGLGTWKSDPGVVGAAVKSAIEMGYRHIDCAKVYQNEPEVGQAFADIFKNKPDLSREDLFVTSKLWNADHAPEDVEGALRKTLKDLQLEYLDLYLIHWPVAAASDGSGALISLDDLPILSTWQAMEKCVEKGLVKSIGVSNFSVKKLKELCEGPAKIKPAVNQVELHPYLQSGELLKFCKEHNIHLTAYSPLGSNDRAPEFRAKGEVPILQDKTVAEIASKYDGATPAQVLLAWGLKRGTSVIPKSVSPERQLQNLKAADLDLSDEDMATIAKLEKNARYVDGAFFCPPGGPYTLENLWDE